MCCARTKSTNGQRLLYCTPFCVWNINWIVTHKTFHHWFFCSYLNVNSHEPLAFIAERRFFFLIYKRVDHFQRKYKVRFWQNTLSDAWKSSKNFSSAVFLCTFKCLHVWIKTQNKIVPFMGAFCMLMKRGKYRNIKVLDDLLWFLE